MTVNDSILVEELSNNRPVTNKATVQIRNFTEPKTGLIGDCPEDCASSYEEQLNNYREPSMRFVLPLFFPR